ncbi:hypothetical protein Bbelb_254440 [Branchiostoma belcheri]|nr:hypothetical protein Bbelb_254440 [Branchiostoma belcheri]
MARDQRQADDGKWITRPQSLHLIWPLFPLMLCAVRSRSVIFSLTKQHIVCGRGRGSRYRLFKECEDCQNSHLPVDNCEINTTQEANSTTQGDDSSDENNSDTSTDSDSSDEEDTSTEDESFNLFSQQELAKPPQVSQKTVSRGLSNSEQLVTVNIQQLVEKRKAEELQVAADIHDMKAFHDGLRAVYGPKASGSAPVRTSDKSTLLTQKTDILPRWAEHFSSVLR